MQCEALKHATSNVVGVRGLLKKKGGGSELFCFASSQLQVDRNSSPFVSLLINLHLKANFKTFIHSQELTTKFRLHYA